MSNARRKADLMLSEVDDDLIVFEPRSGQAHLLNPTAAAIFELSDGRMSDEALAAAIAEAVGGDPAAILLDVSGAISELIALGLLERV